MHVRVLIQTFLHALETVPADFHSFASRRWHPLYRRFVALSMHFLYFLTRACAFPVFNRVLNGFRVDVDNALYTACTFATMQSYSTVLKSNPGKQEGRDQEQPAAAVTPHVTRLNTSKRIYK
jgi:hypothetical protein